MSKIREGGLLIPQIHQISGRIFSRMLRSLKIDTISPAQGRILVALWIGDDIPIQELALRTSLKKSTLTAMLDVLESSGHIRRVPSETDRRKIHIVLANKNRDCKDTYERTARKVVDIGYAGFTSREMEIFEGFLKKMLKNLQDAEEDIAKNRFDE